MCEKAWSRSWSKHSESACAGPETEKEHSALVVDAEWCGSSEGKPSDEKIVSSLADAREELGRLRKTFGSCDNIVSLALASVAALERRCAALEKEYRETAKSPAKDESPQETKGSSSSKEEEYFLVTPIKGVREDGRLLLGDRKILSASALKI